LEFLGSGAGAKTAWVGAGEEFFAGCEEAGDELAGAGFAVFAAGVEAALLAGRSVTGIEAEDEGTLAGLTLAAGMTPARFCRKYQAPPPMSRSAAAASPRNIPFFEPVEET